MAAFVRALIIESSDLLRQSHQEIETARTLIDDSKRIRLQFINTEIDLCRTFAESALASLSAGRVAKAKQSASAAIEAYKVAQKFLRMAGCRR
jgi:hypothetical protein